MGNAEDNGGTGLRHIIGPSLPVESANEIAAAEETDSLLRGDKIRTIRKSIELDSLRHCLII
jgi:hypothetical protein